MVIKQILRESCPNIRILRRGISYVRQKQLLKNTYLDDDIILAENDYDRKKSIVSNFAKSDYKLYKKTCEGIERLFKSASCFQNRSDLEEVCVDMLFCRAAYGFVPNEYVWYELEGKEFEYRRSFVSCRDKHQYQCVINDMVDSSLVTDKVYTYKMFYDYFGRDAIEVSKKDHFEKFKSFVEKYPVFVRKAVYLSGGKGIECIDSNKWRSIDELFDYVFSGGKTLCEELLVQSEMFSSFNPDSVNTVRIVTFATHDKIEIPFVFMRVGRKGSFVDNAGSKGISVGVDPKTGRVMTDGYDELNNHYIVHPDTGKAFCGFQIPEWDKAIEICKAASKRILSLKTISWDIAYTCTKSKNHYEWKMVEANAMGDFICQLVTKKGYKAEMERLIAEANTMVKLKK